MSRLYYLCSKILGAWTRGVQVSLRPPDDWDVAPIYDPQDLPIRTNNVLQQEMQEYLDAGCRDHINGTKYSRLCQLPTISFPWAITVDIMHQLFEGVCKFLVQQ